jgi:hypothetical protein
MAAMTNGMGYREELIANIGFGIWKILLQNLCGSGRDVYVVIITIDTISTYTPQPMFKTSNA